LNKTQNSEKANKPMKIEKRTILHKLKVSEVKKNNETVIKTEDLKIPEIENLKKTIYNLKNQLTETENKLEISNKERTDIKGKLEEFKIDYEVMEERCKDLRFSNNEMQSRIDEKEKIINLQKTEIKNKDETISQLQNEIESLNTYIEKIKSETAKSESRKYSELLTSYNDLEQDYTEHNLKLKTEISNLREIKQLYDALKLTHYEMKNQYELLHLKYQSMSDENYHLKRDHLLYERKSSDSYDRYKSEPIEYVKKLSNDSNGFKEQKSLTSSFSDKKEEKAETRIYNMTLEREKVKHY
jgi:chromosome segregation ATPase